MPTDTTMIWNLILSLFAAGVVWWARSISGQISYVRKRIADTREELARDYCEQEDFEKLIDRVNRLSEKFSERVARG
tara:strand:+ start:352 stop:582 length:231 start_codon:yes stop_codon:yes gene_type:complete